jgi:exodeoxyribonuclease V alpha subunit
MPLFDEASEDERPLRIRLAAPTDRAAARLNESIAGAVASTARSLSSKATRYARRFRSRLPLHRLLGTRPDSRRFSHHAGNPLSLDVLVIDEASMVDLEMMNAVIDALSEHARLILQ